MIETLILTSKDGKKAPLFTDKKVPWKQLFDDLELFFNPDFLNNPLISQRKKFEIIFGIDQSIT